MANKNESKIICYLGCISIDIYAVPVTGYISVDDVNV